MLEQAIARRLRQKTVRRYLRLSPLEGRQRAKLYELSAVLSEETLEDGGWSLELKMTEKDLRRFLKRENLAAELIEPLPVHRSASAANE